jgi:carbon-monoxide dehydrogenase small subunit
MSGARLVTLSVNGREREVRVRARDTLLTVLRGELQLLGAKRGCDQGVCGACTILIDGRAQRACLSLAVNCQGMDITTVEGLSDGADLAPIQQAFLDAGAVQCGYCTSGMLMAAQALLNEIPSPDIEEIRQGISGNLCRCSGFRKIVEAIGEAAR